MATANLGKVMLLPKGNYSAGTTYNRLDFVMYGGSSWVSKVDNNTGNTPSDGDYWQILATAAEEVTVESQTNTYVAQNASDYTGEPPESGWEESIPSVSNGNFLWIKITTEFSGGNSFDSYLVTKTGVNGTGAVSTVNGVSPDGTGNVFLGIGNIATVDSVPTAESNNLVKSGGVLTRILEAVSNLVTKRTGGETPKAYIHTGATQSDLDIDSTPTSGSDNLVTSGGVKNAIDSKLSYGVNLLDNPWFTVNQRGWTSGQLSSGNYCADRWLSFADVPSTVSLDAGGIIISNTTGNGIFDQRMEPEWFNLLAGRKVTLSILYADGTIKSVTSGILPSVEPTSQTTICRITESWGTLNFIFHTTRKYIVRFQLNQNGETPKIRAVKLEIGSVSTLANDTAPNYAAELLKCQRYFQLFSDSSKIPSSLVDYRPNMRITPTTGTISIGGKTYHCSSADL